MFGMALGVFGRGDGDGVCLKGMGTSGSNELSGSDITVDIFMLFHSLIAALSLKIQNVIAWEYR